MNPWILKTVKIRSYEMGLYFRDGEFKGLLGAGRHWFFDPLGKVSVEIVSQRAPWLAHEKLDMIVKSGALKDRAIVLDLKDYERALVWVDGRFSHILPPGLYAYWTTFREVAVEIIDAHKVRFDHKDLRVIVRSPMADRVLDTFAVEQGYVGVLFEDGRYVETLPPGKYAFWKNMAKVLLMPMDLRDTMLDIGGQEIMTADKVTLRLNAVVTYRVTDAHKVLSVVDDVRQALYREAQLALRAVVGARELDQFLADKDAVAKELDAIVRQRVTALGLEVLSVGIRDVILPGDMKDLMNKVTEAKKAAEANLIVRREETAAMRSQANTAKLLEGNPTLMRLRELEVLEKVAASGKLNVVLGEKGLAER
ncbi:MAG: slipin family protein, partial [Thermoguttaceae bacterium]|nr:slipin family protein [Thermoguttaceae bacterium]